MVFPDEADKRLAKNAIRMAMPLAALVGGVIGYGVFSILYRSAALLPADTVVTPAGTMHFYIRIPGDAEFILIAIYVYGVYLLLCRQLGYLALLVASGLHLFGGAMAGYAVGIELEAGISAACGAAGGMASAAVSLPSLFLHWRFVAESPRRPTFSLATAMLVVVAFSGLFGSMAIRRQLSERQWERMQSVETSVPLALPVLVTTSDRYPLVFRTEHWQSQWHTGSHDSPPPSGCTAFAPASRFL